MRAHSSKSRGITDKAGLCPFSFIPAPILVAWSVTLMPAAASSTDFQPALCVDAHASGADDGGCWEDAYVDLQDALDHAEASGGRVTEIWVAAGTYRPTKRTEPDDSRSVISTEASGGIRLTLPR